MPGGDVHRAPIDNPVMPDGYRSGRFESTAAAWPGYAKAYGLPQPEANAQAREQIDAFRAAGQEPTEKLVQAAADTDPGKPDVSTETPQAQDIAEQLGGMSVKEREPHLAALDDALRRDVRAILAGGNTAAQRAAHEAMHTYPTQGQAEQYVKAMNDMYWTSFEEEGVTIPPDQRPDLYYTERKADGTWAAVRNSKGADLLMQLLKDEKGTLEPTKLWNGMVDALSRLFHGRTEAPAAHPPNVEPRVSAVPKDARRPIPAARHRNFDVTEWIGKYFSTSPEMAQGVQDLFDRVGDTVVLPHMRHTQPWTRADALSDRDAVKLSEMWPRGTPMNDHTLMAYTTVYKKIRDDLTAARRVFVEGRATPEQVVEMTRLQAEHDIVVTSLRGASTELGRAMGFLRHVREVMSQTGNNREVFVKMATTFAERQRQMQYELSLTDDPHLQYKIIQKYSKGGLVKQARAYVYGNLLSGIPTQERNIIGNGIDGALELTSRPFAIGAQRAAQALPEAVQKIKMPGHAESSVHKMAQGDMDLKTIAAEHVGRYIGFVKGLSDAAFTVKYGFNPATLRRADVESDFTMRGRHEFETGAIEPGSRSSEALKGTPAEGLNTMNPYNLVPRALEAGDALFRSTGYHGAIYEWAFTEARRQANRMKFKTDGEYKSYIADQMALLRRDVPPEVLARAEHHGARAAIQEEPGVLGRALLRVKSSTEGAGLVFDFLVPFVRTVSNLTRRAAVEYMPWGVVRRLNPELRWAMEHGDPNDVAKVYGRAILGTLLMIPEAMLAARGKLTGGAPPEEANREMFYLQDKLTNAVEVGGKFISHTALGPLSLHAGITASIVHAIQRSKQEALENPLKALTPSSTGFPPWLVNPITEGFGAAIRSMSAQNYLQSLENWLKILEDPSDYAGVFGSQAFSLFFPMSSFVRRGNFAADEGTVRRAGTLYEGLASGIPGLSSTVPPRVDARGEVVKREGGWLSMVSPFDYSTVKDDPIVAELTRLNIKFGQVSSTFTLMGKSSKLPMPIRTPVEQIRAKAEWEAVTKVMQSPRFPSMSDQVRRVVIERERTQALKKANALVNPLIAKFYLQQLREKGEERMLPNPEDAPLYRDREAD